MSEGEDDEDGEWIDVHHSSDEEQQEVVSSKCVLSQIEKRLVNSSPHSLLLPSCGCS